MPEQIDDFVKNLPVKKLFGVGKVTAQKLKNMGIERCGDLHEYDRYELSKTFGRFGERLFQLSRGIDHRSVKTSRIRKSFSIEHTYPHDLPSLENCIHEIPKLYDSFQNRRKKSRPSAEIHKAFVKVKFADFSTTTIERRADWPTLDAYKDLLKEAYQRAEQPVRLLGIGVRFKEIQKTPQFKQLELFSADLCKRQITRILFSKNPSRIIVSTPYGDKHHENKSEQARILARTHSFVESIGYHASGLL